MTKYLFECKPIFHILRTISMTPFVTDRVTLPELLYSDTWHKYLDIIYGDPFQLDNKVPSFTILFRIPPHKTTILLEIMFLELD